MSRRSKKQSAPAHSATQSVAGVRARNSLPDVLRKSKQSSNQGPVLRETLATRRAKRAVLVTSGEPVIQTFRATASKKVLQPKKESISMQDRLNKERLREIYIKNILRNFFSIYFLVLLLLQNGAVFYIVYQALVSGGLKDLQLIFAALVAGTLTETYFITKIIVNFIFSTTDYLYKRDKKPW